MNANKSQRMTYQVERVEDAYVAKMKMKTILMIMLVDPIMVILLAFVMYFVTDDKGAFFLLIFVPLMFSVSLILHESLLKPYIFKKEGVYAKGLFIKHMIQWKDIELCAIDEEKQNINIKIKKTVRAFSYDIGFWRELNNRCPNKPLNMVDK